MSSDDRSESSGDDAGHNRPLTAYYAAVAEGLFSATTMSETTPTLGVAGATRSAGTSTLAWNLASALARHSRRNVLLIRPRGNAYPGLTRRSTEDASPSLQSICQSACDLTEVEWSDTLHSTQLDLVSVAEYEPRPWQWSEDQLTSFRQAMDLRFDRIIVDLATVDEATAWSKGYERQLLKEIVIVLRPGTIRRSEAEIARQSMQRSGFRILGIVLGHP